MHLGKLNPVDVSGSDRAIKKQVYHDAAGQCCDVVLVKFPSGHKQMQICAKRGYGVPRLSVGQLRRLLNRLEEM